MHDGYCVLYGTGKSYSVYSVKCSGSFSFGLGLKFKKRMLFNLIIFVSKEGSSGGETPLNSFKVCFLLADANVYVVNP